MADTNSIYLHIPSSDKEANSSNLPFGNGGFPGGSVVNNLPANAEDTGLIPDPGGSHMPRSN